MTATLYTFSAAGARTYGASNGDQYQFDVQVGEYIDPTRYSVVNIAWPYTDIQWNLTDIFWLPSYTLLSGIQDGVASALKTIGNTPGQFAFAADSLGSVVAAMLYEAIKSSFALSYRLPDFVGAVTFSNPVRQAGCTITNGIDPGGEGCLTDYLMTDTPDTWWNFVNSDPDDPFCTVNPSTPAGLDFSAIANALMTGQFDSGAVLTILGELLSIPFEQLSGYWTDLSELVFPFFDPQTNINGSRNYDQPYNGLADNSMSAVTLAVNYLNTLVQPSVPDPLVTLEANLASVHTLRECL